MYKWDIYEITTDTTPIHGIMLRGRIRKFALENKINLLTENASDKENVVRFAIENGFDADIIIRFIKTITLDANISLVKDNVINPVLSKLKVNMEDRYEI